MGAPIYLGISVLSIMEGLWNGRGGVMPAWGGKLDDVTIKALAVYVHTLGGGVRCPSFGGGARHLQPGLPLK